MTLEILFYLVIGFCILFYVVLDGFDLGVGMLHLFVKKDEERRVFLNAIGPVWDGNEVWLVVTGGALFAGFPAVYATLFSAFYNLCVLLLAGLIFRACAIEFRSKRESPRWRATWDRVFSLASYAIAFGLGVVFGNLIVGIPVDAEGEFVGSFTQFFHPYALLTGVLTVALLMMHGTIYLLMKTESDLHEKIRKFMRPAIAFFFVVFAVVTGATFFFMPHMLDRLFAHPWLFSFPLIAVLAMFAIPHFDKRKQDGRAFTCSCLTIAFLFLIFGLGTYPNMVLSSLDPSFNLTIANAAASPLTMKVLLTIVAIGIPLVLAYGFLVYRIFRGKVKIGPTSY
jgi:cytochrome d ubiquinol oxidase subunit II